MYQNMTPNPIVQLFGTMQNFQNSFNSMQQQIARSGINPQMQVQSLLNSGRMTQEQYNQLRMLANQIMGTNY